MGTYDEEERMGDYQNRTPVKGKTIFQITHEALAARDKEWVAGGDKIFVRIPACWGEPAYAGSPKCGEGTCAPTCHYFQWQQLKQSMGVKE